MGSISEAERKRITETIHGLIQKQAEAGMSSGSKALCHNCGYAKPMAGSVHYGRYRLCNDRALRFELAKARGDVKSVEGFILDE